MASIHHLGLVTLIALALGGVLAWMLKPAQLRHVAAPPAVQTPVERPDAPEPPPAVEESPKPVDEPPAVLEHAPAPSGSGVIKGIVKWEDGSPCTGIKLALQRGRTVPTYDIRLLRPDERIDLLEQIAKHPEHEATTGEDGRFEFAGLPEGTVSITSADHDVRLVPNRNYVKPDADIELKAARVYYATFDFMLDTGERLDSATMRILGGSIIRNPTTWTRGSQHVCEVGPHKVEVTGGKYDAWKATHDFEIPPQGLSGPVAVTLKARNVLIIHREEPENWYTQTGIYILPTDRVPEDLGDAFYKVSGQFRHFGGSTPPNPHVIADLEPASYTILCTVGTNEIVLTETIQFEGGTSEITLKLPEVSLQDHILLRVFDPDDRPIETASIELAVMQDNSGSTRAYLKGNPGEYWIRRTPSRLFSYYNKPFGSAYRISVSTSFGVRVLECPFDQKEPLELRFGKQARLVVLVDGLPADRKEMLLAAYPRGGSEDRAIRDVANWSDSPNIRERHELTMASGPVVVAVVSKPDGGWIDVNPSYVILRREIDLPAEGLEVRIDLSVLSTLRVAHSPELPNQWSFTLRGPTGAKTQRLDENRRAEFRYLSPGTYTIESHQGWMEIVVPVAGEVLFQPQPYNSLYVSTAGSSVMTDEIGFKSGDVIRQINGVALSGSTSELNALFKEAASQGAVSVQVRRGGEYILLRATAEQWQRIEGFYLYGRRATD